MHTSFETFVIVVTCPQFEFFQAVYQEDFALFVDLGGMEANLNFRINDNGANLFHLAVFRGR